MAPRRPDKKSKKKRAAAISRAASGSSSTTSQQQIIPPLLLIRAAEAQLQEGDAEAAAALAQSALDQATTPGSDEALAALNLLGQACLELGELGAAREHYLGAAALDPDGARDEAVGGGAEKFLCLAQLSEEGGADSVRWFEKGAAALRARIQSLEAVTTTTTTTTTTTSPSTTTTTTGRRRRKSGADDADEQQQEDWEAEGEVLKRKLAMALCAAAEVYMTDLSWEADAEARCEALVTEAALAAPGFAETWQTLADVRISQGRPADARAALARSLGLWKGLPPEHPAVPAFPSRVALARLLTEVGMERDALGVLERLVAEDDHSVETWYLGGWGLYVMGEKQREGGKEEEGGEAMKKDGETAGKNGVKEEEQDEDEDEEDWKTSWISSRVWLNQCLHLYKLQDYEDEPLGEHAKELLAAIAKELGDAPADESDGDDDDQDGWEDAGDSDEEMQE